MKNIKQNLVAWALVLSFLSVSQVHPRSKVFQNTRTFVNKTEYPVQLTVRPFVGTAKRVFNLQAGAKESYQVGLTSRVGGVLMPQSR